MMAVRAQLACLEQQAENMRQIKRELLAYRSQLNCDWTAREMVHINQAIDDLSDRSGRLARRLDALYTSLALEA